MNHLTHRYYTELAQNYFQFFWGGGSKQKYQKLCSTHIYPPIICHSNIDYICQVNAHAY